MALDLHFKAIAYKIKIIQKRGVGLVSKKSKATGNSISKALYVISFIIFVLGGIYVFMGISDNSLGVVDILLVTTSILLSGSVPLGLSEVIKVLSQKTE